MKKVILITAVMALFLVKYSYCQLPVDQDSKLITYTEVVNVKGTKTELYSRAVAWFTAFYKKPISDVCQTLDNNNGTLDGKWKIKILDADKKEAGNIEYRITLSLKDGKYKYILTSFIWKKPPAKPLEKLLDKKEAGYDAKFEDYAKQTDTYIKDLITSMKKGMEFKEKKNDNW